MFDSRIIIKLNELRDPKKLDVINICAWLLKPDCIIKNKNYV